MTGKGSKRTLVALGAALFLSLPGQAAAEEVLCLTLFACDRESGEILTEYDDPENPCYPQFQSQCNAYKAVIEAERADIAEEDALRCREQQRHLERRIARLKRRLSRKLRSSR